MLTYNSVVITELTALLNDEIERLKNELTTFNLPENDYIVKRGQISGFRTAIELCDEAMLRADKRERG